MATQNTNPTDNIFSGLKVVDFASFVAGPGAAVILSDFGADVIKVEPPKGELWRIGNKIPPQPLSNVPYMWHLNNRNKRGITLDLKSPDAVKVLERLAKWADVFIVNTPHTAREKLKLTYDDVAQWNPRMIYADITGYGDTGPDAALPGFYIAAFWSRSGLLSLMHDPQDVIKDPQLQANNIVVPLEGAGENMKLTVSSPIQVHGVAKVAAKRGPDLGEHNDEVLQELGFDTKEIERLRAGGVIAKPTAPAKAA